MKIMTLTLACLVSACVAAPPVVAPRGEASAAAAPGKPSIAPAALPPNVTRAVNPDGSITITIREPRNPTAQPWEYSASPVTDTRKDAR